MLCATPAMAQDDASDCGSEGLFSIFSPYVKKYYIGAIVAGGALIWHGFEHFRQK